MCLFLSYMYEFCYIFVSNSYECIDEKRFREEPSLVIPWHLVLLGWITGCSEVKLHDSNSGRNVSSSSISLEISSPDVTATTTNNNNNNNNNISSSHNNNDNNNLRPPSASVPPPTPSSSSKSKRAKSAAPAFVIPETTRAPYGVLTTTLLTVMLCDRCLKNKAIFNLELEPSVKEMTRKLSKHTSSKVITVKRALDSVLMLMDIEEPHWAMSPIRIRCLESHLPLPWTPFSRSRLFQLIMDMCRTDASIDTRGKKGNVWLYS